MEDQKYIDQIVGKDALVEAKTSQIGIGYFVERPLQLVCDLKIGGECESDSGDGIARENAAVPRNGDNIQQRPVNKARRQASLAAGDRLLGVIAKEKAKY